MDDELFLTKMASEILTKYYFEEETLEEKMENALDFAIHLKCLLYVYAIKKRGILGK